MHFLPLEKVVKQTFLIFQIVQYLHLCLLACRVLIHCLCGRIATFISTLALPPFSECSGVKVATGIVSRLQLHSCV